MSDTGATIGVAEANPTGSVEAQFKDRLAVIDKDLATELQIRDEAQATIKRLRADKAECERVLNALKPKTRTTKPKETVPPETTPPTT